jgi:hypothetical protein
MAVYQADHHRCLALLVSSDRHCVFSPNKAHSPQTIFCTGVPTWHGIFKQSIQSFGKPEITRFQLRTTHQ